MGLRFLITILLVLGIFFRFVSLDQKVYWIDEAFTSLRVSGYTEAEVVQQVSNAPLVSIEALQKYQRANAEKSVVDTIKSLAVEDPHHPPLYYVLARFWAQWFGNSVAAMRSLAALFSLMALPCIYRLCIELFDSPLTGLLAVALLAVSPFQVLYAQEAREYSFWTVTILLSSLALLRAMRLQTKMSWSIYAVTLALSLYTFIFSAIVLIGHGVYVVTVERFRLSKRLIAYLLSSVTGILAFLPWLIVFINNWGQFEHDQGWIKEGHSNLLYLCLIIIKNISLSFIDNEFFLNPLIYKDIFRISNLIVLVLIVYSFYFVCKNTPERVSLFILTLTSVTVLSLLLPDLIVGGIRVVTPRYEIPSYLGVQLAVAYLLSTKIIGISTNIWQQKLWQLAMIALVSGGVLSCAINSSIEVPWSKSLGQGVPEVASFLNKANSSLVIGSPTTAELLSLSYKVNLKTQLLVKPKCFTCHVDSNLEEKINIPPIPSSFKDVFLLRTGSFQKWVKGFEEKPEYKLKPILSKTQQILLWRLEKS